MTGSKEFVHLTAGSHDYSCGITTDSNLWCWGYNSDGQQGQGNTTATAAPTRSLALGVLQQQNPTAGDKIQISEKLCALSTQRATSTALATGSMVSLGMAQLRQNVYDLSPRWP